MSPQCIAFNEFKLIRVFQELNAKSTSNLFFDIFPDFESLNKKETYLSWPSFQVENDFEIEFLFLKKLSQSEREHVIPFRLYEFSGC